MNNPKLSSELHPVGSRILVFLHDKNASYKNQSGVTELIVEEWSPAGNVKLKDILHNQIFWMSTNGVNHTYVLDLLPPIIDFANQTVAEPASVRANISCDLRILIRRSPFSGAPIRVLQWRPSQHVTSATGIIGLGGVRYLPWEDVPVVEELTPEQKT